GMTAGVTDPLSASASATDIATAVKAGQVKARAVAEAALARIEKHNPMLGAFTDVTAMRAIDAAELVDGKIANGLDPGPLAGVPYAVKNLYDIKNVVTRAGSKINRERPAARRDATLVGRLDAAGAVLVGA